MFSAYESRPSGYCTLPELTISSLVELQTILEYLWWCKKASPQTLLSIHGLISSDKLRPPTREDATKSCFKVCQGVSHFSQPVKDKKGRGHESQAQEWGSFEVTASNPGSLLSSCDETADKEIAKHFLTSSLGLFTWASLDPWFWLVSEHRSMLCSCCLALIFRIPLITNDVCIPQLS